MFQALVEIQREIYFAIANDIKAFAANSDWFALAAVLPTAIVFGSVHALTPGHSKTVLATYLTGSGASIRHGLLTSLTLSFTHVAIAVMISALALPLVSVALGSVGRAPLLEDISRGLLGMIGLWMIWRAITHRHSDSVAQNGMFGVVAGLVPCPLTLFVMTFAIMRDVPEAGVLFAVAMFLGVTLTLSAVTLMAVFFNRPLAWFFASHPTKLMAISRFIEGTAGLVLLAIALREMLRH